ncbi:MAG TPA: hypothetical protein PLO14_03205 [Accumulibacter sp.]|uniref:hypothetical protein n=1 Tax=Accumulibacter sp. TaxID=2053492 RepID=UPI0025DA4DAE|nr:hypothetical protein [Accumulibacter sp.]MCM8599924.1 hypothetical protein [Accumulibacter sp.]MCM8664108.1 hypothetical protein [Accumulibacter sp.]HNC51236.1 hypothetical protein [Accumulibacter sp.]
MNFDLLKAYFEQVLAKPLEKTTPVRLSGWESAEALWPINERFRANFHQIRSLPYDASCEAAADAAIEALAFHRPGADWADLDAGTWRVLLERQQQALVVALANERAGSPLIPVPSGLPRSARTGAALLFLMHRMNLPFPVQDRSGFEVPRGALPASLRRQ